MRAFRRLIDAIEAEGSAALVTLARVEGSSPREAGARMVVRPSGGFHGTIGGGALEFAALEAAQSALRSGPRTRLPPLARARARAWAMLRRPGRMARRDVRRARSRRSFDLGDRRRRALRRRSRARLGPDGTGRTDVEGERGRGAPIGASPAARAGSSRSATSARAVYLFGAGHVGRALALALAPLPFAVRWIDSRRDAFPAVRARERDAGSSRPSRRRSSRARPTAR